VRSPTGCLPIIVLGLVLLVPFFLANALFLALGKLGLGPTSSLLAAVAMFVGGAINIPVKEIEQERTVEYVPFHLFGLEQFVVPMRERSVTVIAVNVGGCVVPTGLAIYQLVRLAGIDPGLVGLTALSVAVNVGLCYHFAKPVEGQGIAMAPIVPAGAAVACALILTPEWAPPVAFVAGVLGPLIGADLLHLDDIASLGTGMASIGGAGTFDGIVISGLAAVLLTPGLG